MQKTDNKMSVIQICYIHKATELLKVRLESLLQRRD